MKRATVFVVVVALLLSIVAGVAVAKTFQCTDKPCYGTSKDDVITERQGSVSDKIFACDQSQVDNGRCTGNTGDDIVDASVFGNDADKVVTGDGNDRINVADGDSRDVVDCGRGRDTVRADVGDTVKGNCENVTFV